ncbi:hypothetical protein [Sphingomonas sp. TDK1]|uniref:hypothetical protein n=1 Tax=Sphingomonas sp. TDK1 TaxID=453247 RepID=UPI000A078091|nr:hypothetical protein [Sphingomonas sp. TDK1]
MVQIHRVPAKIALIGIAAPLLALAGPSATAHVAQTDQPGAWIVTCDCGTPAKRQRIDARVRKLGGHVLYHYEQIGGMAVAPNKRTRSTRFARALRRVPGVLQVQPDGASQPSRTS